MIVLLLSVPAIIAAFIYKKNTKINSDVKMFYLWLVALFIINLFLLLIVNNNMFLSNIKNIFSNIYDMIRTMELTRASVLLVAEEAYDMLFILLESVAFLYVASLVISILLPICIVLIERFVLKVKFEMKNESQIDKQKKSEHSFFE